MSTTRSPPVSGSTRTPSQQADRLQPRPPPIVERDPLVRVAGQPIGDQGQPSPPVVLFLHVGDDVVRHLRPRVLLDLGLDVVDPRLRRGDLDDQRWSHALVAHAKGLPVLPPLDAEDHRQIGAVVTQSGDVPVDPAIGEDGDRGVVGMPGLEDRPAGRCSRQSWGSPSMWTSPNLGWRTSSRVSGTRFQSGAAVGEPHTDLAVSIGERRLRALGHRAHDRALRMIDRPAVHEHTAPAGRDQPRRGREAPARPDPASLPPGRRVECPDSWPRRLYRLVVAGWAGPEQRRTATVSDARSRLVILGIGDDGLAGLTESARRTLMDSDLILGAPPILSLLEGVPGRKEPLEPDMSLALRQVREALSVATAGAGQRGRPAVLRGGALPLRPAGQGPLRGRAARQQHATGLRPDQGELGGRLPDQPGRPADRGGRRPDPDRREDRRVLQRRLPAVAAGPRAAGPGDRLLPGVCLREPGLARRAGHAGRAGRPGRRRTSTRSTW